MPIYEYACVKCSGHFEVMQKTNDKPLTKCGECGGKLEKQWSQTSVQFKGSGWYVTDYAGKKNGEEKKSGEEKSSGAEKSTEAKGGEMKGSETKGTADKSVSSNGDGGAASGKTEKSLPAKPAANVKS